MRARYAGECDLCGSEWAVGDPIGTWLGKWVHEGCKAARRAAIASGGVRVELPEVRPSEGAQVVGIKSTNRRNLDQINNPYLK